MVAYCLGWTRQRGLDANMAGPHMIRLVPVPFSPHDSFSQVCICTQHTRKFLACLLHFNSMPRCESQKYVDLRRVTKEVPLDARQWSADDL